MSGRVNDDVIDVHYHLIQTLHDQLDQPLKCSRGRRQSHGNHAPLKLAHSWYREGRVGSGAGIQSHLPESRS